MFLPFYIVTLAGSAGMTGVFCRRLLAAYGYVPDFETGVVIALGAAAAYMSVQLGYGALLRCLKPTRDIAPLMSECLSHCGALALAPYLLHVAVPWPHSIFF